MQGLDTLSIVNEMLALQGERPVNSLESTHPSLAGARLFLENRVLRLQAKGWWFNRENATLTPQVGTGYIRIPNDVISFDGFDRKPVYTIRDNRLYNTTDGTYVFDRPVTGLLIRHVPFDAMPVLARAYIGAAAKLAFQNTYDADPQKTVELRREVQETMQDFYAENTRQEGINMFNRPKVARDLALIQSTRVNAGGPFRGSRKYG